MGDFSINEEIESGDNDRPDMGETENAENTDTADIAEKVGSDFDEPAEADQEQKDDNEPDTDIPESIKAEEALEVSDTNQEGDIGEGSGEEREEPAEETETDQFPQNSQNSSTDESTNEQDNETDTETAAENKGKKTFRWFFGKKD